jgi:ESS family glutamate:Na+ symporter
MYGMLTGTVSTGLILLREKDPMYKTPAANNLIFQNLWAIIFGFPMLLLMGVVATGMQMTYITLGILLALFVVMMVILFRKQIFGSKKK